MKPAATKHAVAGEFRRVCSRPACGQPATFSATDQHGDTLRACAGCWPGLLVALRSLGFDVRRTGPTA